MKNELINKMIDNVAKLMEKDHQLSKLTWNAYMHSSLNGFKSEITFSQFKLNCIESFYSANMTIEDDSNADDIVLETGCHSTKFHLNKSSIEELSKFLFDGFKRQFETLYCSYRNF